MKKVVLKLFQKSIYGYVAVLMSRKRRNRLYGGNVFKQHREARQLHSSVGVVEGWEGLAFVRMRELFSRFLISYLESMLCFKGGSE